MNESNEGGKIRIAIVKFAGLAVGGSELWLQRIAAALQKEKIDLDYYYCDAAPYIGSDYKHGDTNEDRRKFMVEHSINLIKFHVGAKDVRSRTHPWVDTDFWNVFDPKKYDVVLTSKAGPKEYPFYLISLPVIEIVALALRPDRSSNIAWSFHSSSWQRAQWIEKGGSIQKSSVLPAPLDIPLTDKNLRAELGIAEDAVVAGFHQRASNEIMSPIPLQAFEEIQKRNPEKDWHFIIKGGGSNYKKQAEELKLRNVHFLPSDGDMVKVSEFLNTIDIFAHGRADGETFGAVLVEAMMHGKPCLSHWTSVANAQPETMGPGGLFAMNEKEYAEFLETFFTDTKFRKKIALKARAHANEYYSMDRSIGTLLPVINTVLGKKEIKATENNVPIPYGYSPMGFLYAGNMNDSSAIAYHVLVGSFPEEFETSLVRFLMPYVKTFIDIGANTGLYCFVAEHESKGDCKVFAYEPQPDCFKTLSKTIELNNWEDVLQVENKGIGDEQTILTLHLSGTGSSFENEFAGQNTLPTIEVPVDTIDHQIKEKNILKVDFIKIDVEGFELKALKGGAITIERDRPMLFIEIAERISEKHYINPHFQTTLSWLRERGYRLFICKKNTIREFLNGEIPPDGVSMYLCLHNTNHKNIIPSLPDFEVKYRKEHLIFGLNKRKVKKVQKLITNPKEFAKKIITKFI